MSALARHLLTLSAERPPASAVFKIGLEALPELADHGFAGLAVLPGAFFLEMACCLQVDRFGAALGPIRRVEFLQPVVLTARDASIQVEAEAAANGTIRYVFREADGSNPCATLEIGTGEVAGSRPPSLSPDAFQRGGATAGKAAVFYARLRRSGNQYGPAFQGLRQLWSRPAESLGRVPMPSRFSGQDDWHLPPLAVDAAIQLLAGLATERERTFVLRGIDEVIRHGMAPAGPAWACAQRSPPSANPDEVTGDLAIYDDEGRCWLELRGVRAVLIAPAPAADPEEAASEIAIAATFTAEPIAETLEFWGDFTGRPVRPAFAPYNQVFQELLDPASRFHCQRTGANAILLNLADWDEATPRLRFDPARIPPEWPDLPRHRLPNGWEVAHLNRHETEDVYREIWVDESYRRHGIALDRVATVIDVGANIGLFSLWIREHCPAATVFAFEPNPAAFRALRANAEAYGPGIHPFHLGVSERRGSAEITCYEKSSVFSSFHPDPEEDRRAIRAVVANSVREGLLGATAVDEVVDEFLADRLDGQVFTCPLVSVSDIIDEHGLDSIDLLKIDAEKCEREILRGIADRHWTAIAQIVVEVHDSTGRVLDEIRATLEERGFDCAVEEEKRLAGSGLFVVYATRLGAASDAAVPAASALDGKVDDFISALTEFNRTTRVPTLVCVCPPERGSDVGGRLAASEARLARGLAEMSQVRVIRAAEMSARYPTTEFHLPRMEGDGHLTYTPEGFAALGTCLFRAWVASHAAPFKVIALDCDETLWAGVCGEDGPLGVRITPAHRLLQEWAVKQMESGMLLCLCSKNRESDVWAVFAQNPGMVLQREHIAAARINWAPKSENLRSLAGELGLGVDAFILLDDDPVVCAEVRASVPTALVLALPADPGGRLGFLDQVWAFDRPGISTTEDLRRTRMVREGAQREAQRAKVSTLGEFIASLGLQVEVAEVTEAQVARGAQLTQRTNQFNFTTIRRTEAELRRFLAGPGAQGLIVGVRDRFGDYGQVGLVLFQVAGERCRIDTMLLSCRVLGRGVEHRLLAEVGRRAQGAGAKEVEVPFRPTERNQPARDFLAGLGGGDELSRAGETILTWPVDKVRQVSYDPEAAPVRANEVPAVSASAATGARPDLLVRIAEDLGDTRRICAAQEAWRRRSLGLAEESGDEPLPRNLAGRLLALWRRTLRRPRLGPDDNFLEAGGTSLNAAQLAAAIRQELGQPVAVVTVFECPTVRLMAAKLEPQEKGPSSGDDALERGARRHRRQRHRAASPDLI